MALLTLPGKYPAAQHDPFAPPPAHRPIELDPVTARDTSAVYGAVPLSLLLRHATSGQGRALRILGHAAEYLIESRIFLVEQACPRSDAEATRILMRLSRLVFTDRHTDS